MAIKVTDTRQHRWVPLDPARSADLANGSVIRAGTPAYACPECKGKGTVTLFTSIAPCRLCSGAGVRFKSAEGIRYIVSMSCPT